MEFRRTACSLYPFPDILYVQRPSYFEKSAGGRMETEDIILGKAKYEDWRSMAYPLPGCILISRHPP